MAIFTVPASVQKNVAGTFTISYSELAAIDAVPAGYYKNTNNWKELLVKVSHEGSNQRGIMKFISPSNTASLLISDSGRSGTWNVESIIIRDYDDGEVLVKNTDIPDVANYNFNVVSAATHGDLNVGNGETIEIPSGGKRQYGDLVIASGGTLKLADGGGITELEVLGNCRIDGVILANNGKHLSGTWNSTSVLGESLSHEVIQLAGGNGGSGEDNIVDERNPETGEAFSTDPNTYWFVNNTHNSANVVWDGATVAGDSDGTVTSITIGDTTYYRGAYQDEYLSYSRYAVYSETSSGSVGGSGGANISGNGGGGGRSSAFGALAGGSASTAQGGLGAGQDDAATDEYGENGAHSATQSEAGNGGFRGAHGQGLYIKARRIDGVGAINASGQKGGNGGNGAEYLSGGLLYANGAGGGGAGGQGGTVWLRYAQGSPTVTVTVTGGERGTSGTNVDGAGTAEHGSAGAAGTLDSASY